MYLLTLLICLIIFIFTLYRLSRDDFVFLRRDIAIETVFNMAFLCAIIALLFARIFYAIFNPSEILFTVLGFIAFPYFPGFSLVGGILGGLLFLISYGIYKKLPIGRFIDFFSIALLASISLGAFITFFISPQKIKPYIALEFVLFFLLLIVFLKFILPFLSRGRLKDGSIGLLFLMFFSVISLAGNTLKFFAFNINRENVVLVLLFLISLLFFGIRELRNKLSLKK